MAPRLSIAQYSEGGKDPTVLSCEGKEGVGEAKINNKAFCKKTQGETILNIVVVCAVVFLNHFSGLLFSNTPFHSGAERWRQIPRSPGQWLLASLPAQGLGRQSKEAWCQSPALSQFAYPGL